jgi:branched-chain amino acid transport system substrate-binding protein
VDVIGFDTSVIPEIASRIVTTHPDVVFCGGVTSSGAGLLKAQLTSLGYKGFFLGGDAIANDPAFVTQAGSDAADGAFASVGVRDPSTFTSGAAARFLTDYTARYPGQSPTNYGADAYDAGMVLIEAVRQVIRTGQAVTRAGVVAQVQRTQYAGVTGVISFDVNGGVTHGIYSIYVVRQGKWTYAFQVNV